MTKTLNILIGDDEFADPFTDMIFRQEYIPRLQNQVPHYQFNWKCETTPPEVINEAQTGKYEVVVTDLDYTGAGKGKEGYEVIDAISKMIPKPLLVLCTSSDNIAEIQQRTQGKIDFRAGAQKGHKFDDLIAILTKHFNTEEEK